jgi:hypothetical protein
MNTTFRKFLHTAKLELFDKNFARSSGQLGQARLRPIRPEPRTCTPRQAQKCTGLARIMQAGATCRGNMLRLPRHAHDRPSSTLAHFHSGAPVVWPLLLRPCMAEPSPATKLAPVAGPPLMLDPDCPGRKPPKRVLSACRTHTKTVLKEDLLWRMPRILRALNRAGWPRTVCGRMPSPVDPLERGRPSPATQGRSSAGTRRRE